MNIPLPGETISLNPPGRPSMQWPPPYRGFPVFESIPLPPVQNIPAFLPQTIPVAENASVPDDALYSPSRATSEEDSKPGMQCPPEIPAVLPSKTPVLGKEQAKKRLLAFSKAKRGSGLSFGITKMGSKVSKAASMAFNDEEDEKKDVRKRGKKREEKEVLAIEEIKREEEKMKEALSMRAAANLEFRRAGHGLGRKRRRASSADRGSTSHPSGSSRSYRKSRIRKEGKDGEKSREGEGVRRKERSRDRHRSRRYEKIRDAVAADHRAQNKLVPEEKETPCDLQVPYKLEGTRNDGSLGGVSEERLHDESQPDKWQPTSNCWHQKCSPPAFLLGSLVNDKSCWPEPVFVAKGVNGEDKEYPSSSVMYTKTKPSLSYCKSPMSGLRSIVSREEIFRIESEEVVGEMSRIIGGAVERVQEELVADQGSPVSEEAVGSRAEKTCRQWYVDDALELVDFQRAEQEFGMQVEGGELEQMGEGHVHGSGCLSECSETPIQVTSNWGGSHILEGPEEQATADDGTIPVALETPTQAEKDKEIAGDEENCREGQVRQPALPKECDYEHQRNEQKLASEYEEFMKAVTLSLESPATLHSDAPCIAQGTALEEDTVCRQEEKADVQDGFSTMSEDDKESSSSSRASESTGMKQELSASRKNKAPDSDDTTSSMSSDSSNDSSSESTLDSDSSSDCSSSSNSSLDSSSDSDFSSDCSTDSSSSGSSVERLRKRGRKKRRGGKSHKAKGKKKRRYKQKKTKRIKKRRKKREFDSSSSDSRDAPLKELGLEKRIKCRKRSVDVMSCSSSDSAKRRGSCHGSSETSPDVPSSPASKEKPLWKDEPRGDTGSESSSRESTASKSHGDDEHSDNTAEDEEELRPSTPGARQVKSDGLESNSAVLQRDDSPVQEVHGERTLSSRTEQFCTVDGKAPWERKRQSPPAAEPSSLAARPRRRSGSGSPHGPALLPSSPLPGMKDGGGGSDFTVPLNFRSKGTGSCSEELKGTDSGGASENKGVSFNWESSSDEDTCRGKMDPKERHTGRDLRSLHCPKQLRDELRRQILQEPRDSPVMKNLLNIVSFLDVEGKSSDESTNDKTVVSKSVEEQMPSASSSDARVVAPKLATKPIGIKLAPRTKLQRVELPGFETELDQADNGKLAVSKGNLLDVSGSSAPSLEDVGEANDGRPFADRVAPAQSGEERASKKFHQWEDGNSPWSSCEENDAVKSQRARKVSLPENGSETTCKSSCSPKPNTYVHTNMLKEGEEVSPVGNLAAKVKESSPLPCMAMPKAKCQVDASPGPRGPSHSLRFRESSQEKVASPHSPPRSPRFPKRGQSNFKSPKRSRSRSPGRSCSKSPVRSHSTSPVRSCSKSPGRSRSTSPTRSRSKSPKSPKSSRSKSPKRSRFSSPKKSRFNSPKRSRFDSPRRSRSKSPKRPHSKSPRRSRSNSPSPQRSSRTAWEESLEQRRRDRDKRRSSDWDWERGRSRDAYRQREGKRWRERDHRSQGHWEERRLRFRSPPSPHRRSWSRSPERRGQGSPKYARKERQQHDGGKWERFSAAEGQWRASRWDYNPVEDIPMPIESVPLPSMPFQRPPYGDQWRENSSLAGNFEQLSPSISPLGLKRSVADSTISDAELAGLAAKQEVGVAKQQQQQQQGATGDSDVHQLKSLEPPAPMQDQEDVDKLQFSPRKMSLDERIAHELGISPTPQNSYEGKPQCVSGYQHYQSVMPPEGYVSHYSYPWYYPLQANELKLQGHHSLGEHGFPLEPRQGHCKQMSSDGSLSHQPKRRWGEGKQEEDKLADDWDNPEAFVGSQWYPPAGPTSRVVQMGNVLQVVPADLAATSAASGRSMVSPASIAPEVVPSTKSSCGPSSQVVQVGNVLQVVPSTSVSGAVHGVPRVTAAICCEASPAASALLPLRNKVPATAPAAGAALDPPAPIPLPVALPPTVGISRACLVPTRASLPVVSNPSSVVPRPVPSPSALPLPGSPAAPDALKPSEPSLVKGPAKQEPLPCPSPSALTPNTTVPSSVTPVAVFPAAFTSPVSTLQSLLAPALASPVQLHPLILAAQSPSPTTPPPPPPPPPHPLPALAPTPTPAPGTASAQAPPTTTLSLLHTASSLQQQEANNGQVAQVSGPLPMLPYISMVPPPATVGQSILAHQQQVEKKRKEKKKKERREKAQPKTLPAADEVATQESDAVLQAIIKEGDDKFEESFEGDIDPEEMKLIQEAISEVPGEETDTPASPPPPSASKVTKTKRRKKQQPPVEAIALPPAGKGILISAGFREKPLLDDSKEKRKSVMFADGIKPGEGTSPSGGEDMPSPPPPPAKPPKEKCFRKKKKVKVKVIRQPNTAEDDDDEDDDSSPPPPPPGSPPPYCQPYRQLMSHYPYPPAGYVYSARPYRVVHQTGPSQSSGAPVQSLYRPQQSGFSSAGVLYQRVLAGNLNQAGVPRLRFALPVGTVLPPMASQAVAAQGMAAQGRTPQRVVPQGVAPQGVVPQGVVPQSVVPQVVVPQGVVPHRVALKPETSVNMVLGRNMAAGSPVPNSPRIPMSHPQRLISVPHHPSSLVPLSSLPFMHPPPIQGLPPKKAGGKDKENTSK